MTSLSLDYDTRLLVINIDVYIIYIYIYINRYQFEFPVLIRSKQFIKSDRGEMNRTKRVIEIFVDIRFVQSRNNINYSWKWDIHRVIRAKTFKAYAYGN